MLVLDTQKGCFNENLYLFENVKNNIKQLISVARKNNVEVIYVQHDDGPGTDLTSLRQKKFSLWFSLRITERKSVMRVSASEKGTPIRMHSATWMNPGEGVIW